MGFTLHIYIISGTNLLTGGPTRIAVFYLFQCFEEKEYQTESKRNETFRIVIFGTNVIQRTSSAGQEAVEAAMRVEGAPTPTGRAPYLVGPSGVHRPTSSSYMYPRTREHQRRRRKTISTTVTFCIREITSWSLRRCSTGGGIDHGGLLHQHHSPSDEL